MPTTASVAGVSLSNPQKVLFADVSITKLQLAEYYETISGWILPHVGGRPLMLLRCPQGSERDCFIQKHFIGDLPEGLSPIEIEENGKQAVYGVIDDVRGLVSLVQLGVLEIHAWGSLARDLEHPDRLIFDLDPSPELPWSSVVAAARRVRNRLTDIGLESWPKSTGGKGLHVVVPLVPESGWDEVKALARTFAESVAGESPELFVTKASKALRKGKIYLDYLRNGRGATSIASYSPRSRPGAPTAVPLRWAELDSRPRSYSLNETAGRLARLKADPWAEFWKQPQSLEIALGRRSGQRRVSR